MQSVNDEDWEAPFHFHNGRKIYNKTSLEAYFSILLKSSKRCFRPANFSREEFWLAQISRFQDVSKTQFSMDTTKILDLGSGLQAIYN